MNGIFIKGSPPIKTNKQHFIGKPLPGFRPYLLKKINDAFGRLKAHHFLTPFVKVTIQLSITAILTAQVAGIRHLKNQLLQIRQFFFDISAVITPSYWCPSPSK